MLGASVFAFGLPRLRASFRFAVWSAFRAAGYQLARPHLPSTLTNSPADFRRERFDPTIGMKFFEVVLKPPSNKAFVTSLTDCGAFAMSRNFTIAAGIGIRKNESNLISFDCS